jgi:hypothetical protein
MVPIPDTAPIGDHKKPDHNQGSTQPQAYLRTETVRVLAASECEQREGFTLVCSELSGLGSCDNKDYTCTVSAEKMCSCK